MMKALIIALLFLSLFRTTSSQEIQYDFSSRGSCSKPYNAAVKACNLPTSSIFPSVQETQCVCSQDPTWDKDILDCVMAWVNPALSNGGNAGELSTAIWYELRISCGPRPASTANLTSTDLACRSIYQTVETCGGDGQALESCICGYKYMWNSQIGGVGRVQDCPKTIEQAGDAALGASIRAWQSFACGPSPWVYSWNGGSASSTITTATRTSTRTSTSASTSTSSAGAASATSVAILYNAFILAMVGDRKSVV